MFISQSQKFYFSRNSNGWVLDYVLVDSEFGEVSGTALDFLIPESCNWNIASPAPIIIEYRKRGLNVEGNLIGWLLWECRRFSLSLKYLLQKLNDISGREQNQAFRDLWKTVDQQRLLRLTVFV